jgi:hypothetical protein
LRLSLWIEVITWKQKGRRSEGAAPVALASVC